ncbi:hypothetical protein M408DRAFT_327869 [Serendipita vermifera MAFF 305830]|uniref:Uncharacterized protein n=1 Tax=Serendipita vermifera MAFF 305830 TaxID=933852 RepID=A0A0C3BFL3_SERVB|nr:hypothetical protein M408DRAFT_327869 [Serendipita vermifera MAFF 305830]
MAVVISAQKSIFRRDLKPSDAFVAVLQQYSVSPQRQTVALAVKEISIAMPPRLHEDTRDEWEETLQALLDIARNNFLDPQ